jgi:hypothetical protein
MSWPQWNCMRQLEKADRNFFLLDLGVDTIPGFVEIFARAMKRKLSLDSLDTVPVKNAASLDPLSKSYVLRPRRSLLFSQITGSATLSCDWQLLEEMTCSVFSM